MATEAQRARMKMLVGERAHDLDDAPGRLSKLAKAVDRAVFRMVNSMFEENADWPLGPEEAKAIAALVESVSDRAAQVDDLLHGIWWAAREKAMAA